MKKIFLPLIVVLNFMYIGSVSSQSLLESADKEFNDTNFDKAIELYNKYLSDDANMENGRAWLNLAFSYYQTEDYDNALKSFLKAEKNKGPVNIRAIVQTGTCYLMTDNKEKFYEYIEKAVDAGLPPRILKTNNKFDSVREEDKFNSLVSKAEDIAFPCRNDPMSRQFDFWLGEWEVYANGQKVANSHIDYSLEGCLIIENYETFGGYSGKSINFYDVGDKKWHQIWTDISGNISRYEGELKDGKMYLYGENIDKAGTKSLVRMEFTPNNDGSVRQLYEGSTDGGKTWSIYFDGRYVKKK